MNTIRSSALALMASAACVFSLNAQDAKEAPKKDQAKLEQQFKEELSGVALVGYFTTTGKEDDKLREERYEIQEVSKLSGTTWLLKARIKYGNHDVTLPLPLRIEWADDTPVITLTDQAIPGLGTFTSRVMIYRGRYAGTWQHDQVGGHLFGVIEKLKTAEPATPKTAN